MSRVPRVPNGGRRRSTVLAALLAAVGLLVAGCAPSADKATSASSPAADASASSGTTGTPVKTMTIADINSSGAVYANIKVTAGAAEKYLNEHGGVHGAPLKAEFCDSQGTADGAANCARQAVSDGVTAVVGSFNFSPDAMVEVLEAANIPYFGQCCALGAKENTSKDSFPIGSIQMYGVGEVKQAVADGCQHIKGLVIQGAESFWPPMQTAAKRLGAADKLDPKYVSQPGTVQDQSAQVAQLLAGGTDCVVSVTSETPLTAFMVAWDAAKPKARFYGPQGNLNKVSAKGHEKILEGARVVGVYPDISCPAWADYRSALDAVKADETQDYNSLGGLGTWTAFMAFKQIADSMTGTIDGPSFKAAANAFPKIDLPGMVPPLTFTKEWTEYPGLLRSVNHSVVYSQIKGGDVAALGDCEKFDDVGALVQNGELTERSEGAATAAPSGVPPHVASPSRRRSGATLTKGRDHAAGPHRTRRVHHALRGVAVRPPALRVPAGAAVVDHLRGGGPGRRPGDAPARRGA